MNKQINLFGKETDQPIDNKKPRTIKEKFRAKYGYKKGYYCRNCKQLVNSRFYKCRLIGITNGAATDIRLKHIACRLYEPKIIKEVQDERE